VKVIGTDWWFRFDQASAGDKAHYHFVKGSPNKSHSIFYERRVYIDPKKSGDEAISQKHHGGGKGGVDEDVPLDIIKKAVSQKGGDNSSEKITLREPLFGLLGIENLDNNSYIAYPGTEEYPLVYPLISNDLGPVSFEVAVSRNKETGGLDFTILSARSTTSGKDITPFLLTTPTDLPSFSRMKLLPRLVPVPVP
jgi:hypothetical protein